MIVYKINVLQELKHTKDIQLMSCGEIESWEKLRYKRFGRVNLLVKKLSIQSVDYCRYSPETCLNMWRRYRC